MKEFARERVAPVLLVPVSVTVVAVPVLLPVATDPALLTTAAALVPLVTQNWLMAAVPAGGRVHVSTTD